MAAVQGRVPVAIRHPFAIGLVFVRFGCFQATLFQQKPSISGDMGEKAVAMAALSRSCCTDVMPLTTVVTGCERA